MFIIEPCCTQRHWPELRKMLGDDGTVEWEGYGDLSITELLPVMLLPYSEVEMIVATPSLPNQAAESLRFWMKKKWSTRDGGRADVISRLTIVADLSEKKSPLASGWLKVNPFGNRLVLENTEQHDTAIILPDMALYGPINMAYGYHFHALATKCRQTIDELRARILSQARHTLPLTQSNKRSIM